MDLESVQEIVNSGGVGGAGSTSNREFEIVRIRELEIERIRD